MAALRAGSLAFLLSLIGTTAAAALILAPPPTPSTIVGALAAPVDAALDVRRDWAVEASVQACMARLGLPYTPIISTFPEIPEADLGPEAWAERWGFGIATSVVMAPTIGQADPNERYLATLADPMRARYRAALYGDGARRPGCHGMAVDAVHGLRDRELAPLHGQLMELDRAIAADPGRRVVLASWATCVRALGIADSDRATLTDRMHRSFAERATRVRGDPRLLAAVADEERRIAAGIARCEADHQAAMATVAAPHETRFVAANHGLLARIGARIRAAEAAYPDQPPISRPGGPTLGRDRLVATGGR